MDDILQKAAELGKMIQQTDLYENYQKALQEVENNSESSRLMNQYNETVTSFDQRINAGDIIESYEKEALRDLTAEIETNDVLMEFLKAQKKYSDFLVEIQEKVLSLEN